MIVEQVHTRKNVGNYIIQNIEDMIIETKLYRTLKSMTFDIIKEYIATSSHMFHAIEYNFTNDISISVKYGELHSQREGDKPIIQLASMFLQRKMTSNQFKVSGYF